MAEILAAGASAVGTGRNAGPNRALFVATIFAGSFLLFLIQPMVARMVLPQLGGAPNVWNSAMLVYQALLLAGYAYAHRLSRIPLRRQATIHVALLALAATVPIAWRRTHPAVVLLVVTTSQMLMEAFSMAGPGWTGVLIGAYSLGAHRSGPTLWRLSGIAFLLIPLEIPFASAIFEAVEADDGQMSAGLQQSRSRRKKPIQVLQLAVDRNPQRLKRPRSRMLPRYIG